MTHSGDEDGGDDDTGDNARAQFSNLESPSQGGPKGVIKDTMRKPLAKRFYKTASASAVAPFLILLDGRAVKTPAKRPLNLPTRASADAVAAEWAAQVDVVNPARMPMTRFANSAIDAVAQTLEAVAGDIVAFAGRDHLCYRAEGPATLTAAQSKAWDPILSWLERAQAIRLRVVTGIMPIEQPRDALDRFAAALKPLEPFGLTALHVMTTMTGSAVLALAVARGQLSSADAWTAAHVDEDYQIALWGQDTEAAERRQRRWQDFEAACQFYRLVQPVAA